MTFGLKTKRAVVAVASASLLVVPGIGAEAHRFKESSTVTIRWDKPRFKGRVRSDRPFCRRNRKVVVRRQKRGPDPVVGRDRTNRRGRYSINPRPNPRRGQRYYAVAKPKKKKKHRHSHVCRRARSRTIKIRRR